MIVECEYDLQQMCRELRQVSGRNLPIAIDTETSGLQVNRDGRDYCTGIAVAYDHYEYGVRSWYVPVAHANTENVPIDKLYPLITQFNAHDGVTLYHHAPFDWSVLKRVCSSFRPPKRLWDTLVAAWLIDENMTHSLKGLGAIYFGEDAAEEQKALKKLMRGGKSWADLSAEDIYKYAEQDVRLTLKLASQQKKIIEWGNAGCTTLEAVKRECDFQQVVWQLNETGVAIDVDKVKHLREDAQRRADEITEDFPVNIDSPAQVAKYLYEDLELRCLETTPSGAPSVAKNALEPHADHAIVKLILEYRKLSKAVRTYYDALLDAVEVDGRVRPWFSSTRTVTGRLSCAGPNLMTIPRGDTLVGVRDCFTAAPGYTLWEYDLKSAELMVQAAITGDELLTRILLEGRDRHSETAAAMYGENFTGLQRRLAKALNYGFAYGIGPKKFARYLVAGTSEPVTQHVVARARETLNDYASAYGGLTRAMRGMGRYADKHGYVPLHKEGRYRRFRSPGKVTPSYNALNAVVQGGVAELMKDVMLEVEQPLDNIGARLCLQVHDSLVIEVPENINGQVVGDVIQSVTDRINPFSLRMVWDAQPWSAHE